MEIKQEIFEPIPAMAAQEPARHVLTLTVQVEMESDSLPSSQEATSIILRALHHAKREDIDGHVTSGPAPDAAAVNTGSTRVSLTWRSDSPLFPLKSVRLPV